MSAPTEGGVITDPTWPDGCRLTLRELSLSSVGAGHVDCERTPTVKENDR